MGGGSFESILRHCQWLKCVVSTTRKQKVNQIWHSVGLSKVHFPTFDTLYNLVSLLSKEKWQFFSDIHKALQWLHKNFQHCWLLLPIFSDQLVVCSCIRLNFVLMCLKTDTKVVVITCLWVFLSNKEWLKTVTDLKATILTIEKQPRTSTENFLAFLNNK